MFGAVLGAAVSGPIGTIIGAAAGASAAGVFSSNVDAARNKVRRCREQVQRAQSDVNSTRKQLSDTETQIACLSQQCGELEKQQSQYNDEAEIMKEAVLFFLRAAVYWIEFHQISEHGVDHTALMQEIIHIMTKEKDLSWLGEKMKIGLTFLEAWEIIETKINNIMLKELSLQCFIHQS